MKTKLLKLFLITLITVLFIITYNQYQEINSFKLSEGLSYQKSVRAAMNATDKDNLELDIKPNKETYRFATSLMHYSMNLGEISKNEMSLVSHNLNALSKTMQKEELTQSEINEIKKEFYKINQFLSYINTHISDNPKEWYKEINKENSKVIEAAFNLYTEGSK